MVSSACLHAGRRPSEGRLRRALCGKGQGCGQGDTLRRKLDALAFQ
jgi:hypothetical protein